MRVGGGWPLVLAIVVIAACSDPAADAPTVGTSPTTAAITSPTTTGTPPTTTTVTLPTTTVTLPTTTGGPGANPVPEVRLPEHPEGAPTVVLVHGGGWLGGSPASMDRLAEALAERGAIVVNAGYRTGVRGGGFPATFDDIACAVRFAREQSDELGGSGDLSLVGHSAGAHIATVVALSLDTFGPDCPWEGSSTPERLVGLAGVYQLESVAPLMEIFLGGDETDRPSAWEAADPIRHLDAADGISITLVHGDADSVIPTSASESFANLLAENDHDASLVIIAGASHNDLINPAFTAATILP